MVIEYVSADRTPPIICLGCRSCDILIQQVPGQPPRVYCRVHASRPRTGPAYVPPGYRPTPSDVYRPDAARRAQSESPEKRERELLNLRANHARQKRLIAEQHREIQALRSRIWEMETYRPLVRFQAPFLLPESLVQRELPIQMNGVKIA